MMVFSTTAVLIGDTKQSNKQANIYSKKNRILFVDGSGYADT